jgi:hypothetical protein
MLINNRSFVCISTLFASLGAMAACHEDIISASTNSATDDEAIFGTTTSSTSSDTEAIPTTSSGDTMGEGIDPTQFCELRPSDDYPGVLYVCSGHAAVNLYFDYYGDDASIGAKLVCIDLTEPPTSLEKPEDYVFTCQIVLNRVFSTDDILPNGHRIDACCLQDSPFEAPADYCRVDAAEELARGLSDALNDFRMNLPSIPKLAEVNQQLESLNKYVAASNTQTACSQHLAKEFVKFGNVDVFPTVQWSIEHPQALDPEVGWPWFRDLRLVVYDLEIASAENDGTPCSEIGKDAVTGDIAEGTVLLKSHLGSVNASVDGQASYTRADCRHSSCEFRLETFSLKVDNFELDRYSFTDISVALATPTTGLINGDMIGLPGNQMHMTATFRVAEDGEPMFEGAPVSVGLQNHGVAQLRLLPDSSIAVERLDVSRWPLEMGLVSKVSN